MDRMLAIPRCRRRHVFSCPSPLLLPFLEKEAENIRKKSVVAVVVIVEPVVPRFTHKEAMNKNCSICGKYLLNWQKKEKQGTKPAGMGCHEFHVSRRISRRTPSITQLCIGVNRQRLGIHFDV